jgi:hypothetical protein
MNPYLRLLLFALCLLQAVFAVAFFLQAPFALTLWPWGATGRLSYIFISSIFAAAAASTLWCVASRRYGALSGIALDYVVIFVPMAIYALESAARASDPALLAFGAACAIGAVFGVALFMWSWRLPLDSAPPMPALVRWSFVVFILALVIVGVRMVLGAPNVLPWTITADLSVVIGLIFLGAAAYFLYALSRPTWSNTAGQLAGFLAYDVVLIVPFLQRVPTVEPVFQTSLAIYIVVVVYSGLLAIFYLFLNPRTRIVLRASSAV